MADIIPNNNKEQLNLWNFKTEVTSEELRLLKQLKERVEDLNNEEMTQPATLLRFLRGRDCDINRAEQMLRKSAKWREENNVSSYRSGYTLPKSLAEDYIYKILGNDSQGYPILYIPLGRWNIRDRINDGYLEDTLEARFFLLEGIVMSAIDRSTKNEFVLVVDLAQLSFYKCAHMDTMNVVIKIFQDFDANYPERLKSAFIINTPWVFPYAFSIVKPWIAPKTLSKVSVYDGNREKWMPTFIKNVPEKIFPSELLD